MSKETTKTTNVTCTRRLQFCAGHRVLNHEGKCKHPHGHNYVLFAEAMGDLDTIGRVIDFSVIKEKLGDWIDIHWDHGFIIFSQDDELLDALKPLGQKTYVISLNPTAENMASFLLNYVCPVLFADTGVTIRKITLWETENCYAEAEISQMTIEIKSEPFKLDEDLLKETIAKDIEKIKKPGSTL